MIKNVRDLSQIKKKKKNDPEATGLLLELREDTEWQHLHCSQPHQNTNPTQTQPHCSQGHFKQMLSLFQTLSLSLLFFLSLLLYIQPLTLLESIPEGTISSSKELFLLKGHSAITEPCVLHLFSFPIYHAKY